MICDIDGCHAQAEIITLDQLGYLWRLCFDCKAELGWEELEPMDRSLSGYTASNMREELPPYITPARRPETSWPFLIPAAVALVLGVWGLMFGPFWAGVGFIAAAFGLVRRGLR